MKQATNISHLTSDNFNETVKKAATTLQEGGIIIAPFDTVYGFLANAEDQTAIEKIYQLKERPINKPFGIVLSNINQINTYFSLDDKSNNFISERVPGRYTFILNAGKTLRISPYCKKDDTVGVRIPDSNLIRKIAAESGLILAQTSANKSNMPSNSSLQKTLEQFSQEEIGEIDLIIDGGTIDHSAPSRIFDLTSEVPAEIER